MDWAGKKIFLKTHTIGIIKQKEPLTESHAVETIALRTTKTRAKKKPPVNFAESGIMIQKRKLYWFSTTVMKKAAKEGTNATTKEEECSRTG